VEKAADTMVGAAETNNMTLRNDVLKQAEASLSAYVGKVNFSNTFSAATALQVGQVPLVSAADAGGAQPAGAPPTGVPVERDPTTLLFDVDKLSCAVEHANDMTMRYGVQVLSINIISAKPADTMLMQCLAKGAVAAAEAQQLETIARGRAKAAAIDAKGKAEALRVSAAAQADAEVTRAEGSQAAAAKLRQEPVAVKLATIAATGEALNRARSSLILGHEPGQINSLLLSNPDVTRTMLSDDGERRPPDLQ